MQQQQIGVVAALWRYPIKSMRGESIAAAAVTTYGLAGDRAWALRESQYGGVMSARTWPAMLQLRASWTQDPNQNATADPTPSPLTDAGARVRIELPDGAILHHDDPAVARLFQVTGHENSNQSLLP